MNVGKTLPQMSKRDCTTSGPATGVGLLLEWSRFQDLWFAEAAFLIAIVSGGWHLA